MGWRWYGCIGTNGEFGVLELSCSQDGNSDYSRAGWLGVRVEVEIGVSFLSFAHSEVWPPGEAGGKLWWLKAHLKLCWPIMHELFPGSPCRHSHSVCLVSVLSFVPSPLGRSVCSCLP
jgi:hypothetical protein